VHLGYKHEGQVFPATPFNLPRAENTTAVGVNQDRDNLLGMIGMLAFDAVATFKR
jgi:hypothetical protein